MDFFFDMKILYFLDPEPEVFPPREPIQEDKFNIDQLRSLINEIKYNSEDGKIDNETLIDLLLTRTRNSNNFND